MKYTNDTYPKRNSVFYTPDEENHKPAEYEDFNKNTESAGTYLPSLYLSFNLLTVFSEKCNVNFLL